MNRDHPTAHSQSEEERDGSSGSAPSSPHRSTASLKVDLKKKRTRSHKFPNEMTSHWKIKPHPTMDIKMMEPRTISKTNFKPISPSLKINSTSFYNHFKDAQSDYIESDMHPAWTLPSRDESQPRYDSMHHQPHHYGPQRGYEKQDGIYPTIQNPLLIPVEDTMSKPNGQKPFGYNPDREPIPQRDHSLPQISDARSADHSPIILPLGRYAPTSSIT
eukprot:TRINITY_DN11114_c0_g1_i1.p1 TRINITY_DN11114_c0_g1~~TRINITY_DN11114_c0_g1_i1.p1  ORF type:complete len:230 (-),score=67.45 TRINITY_DN11114_c0_g1_i1:74-724(-)